MTRRLRKWRQCDGYVQAGKSTVVALLGLVEAVFEPLTQVLLVSRSHRQSRELFRITTDFFRRMGEPLRERQTADELQLSNRSRIACLPCREETIRGYSRVTLLVIDEAARVPDDLYRAVRPMLAVSDGRLFCLSTPYGKRGFFHEAWSRGGADWHRIEVPAGRIGRIRPEFLAQERRALGLSWYRQEYECSFEALEGLVYPDFARCVVPSLACPTGGDWPPSLPAHVVGEAAVLRGKRVGGIDFGFRTPFAAVWGKLDGAAVLWLTGEHYSRGKPLSHHARCLPRDVAWYADPSGATERAELRRLPGAGRRQRPAPGDRGRQRPPGERHLAGAGGALPQPAGRGGAIPLRRGRRVAAGRGPGGRAQPRAGGARRPCRRCTGRWASPAACWPTSCPTAASSCSTATCAAT
jgi:hypothetical protein